MSEQNQSEPPNASAPAVASGELLAACPFCRGTGKLKMTHLNHFHVECDACGARQGGSSLSKGIAIATWNTRPTCEWTEDENGPHKSQCGHDFEFTYDGVERNGFRVCPFCGSNIIVKQANDGTQRPGSPDGLLATETRKPGSLK